MNNSEKSALRKEIAKRLDTGYCRERDKAAIPLLLTLSEFVEAKTVMLYYGIGMEPETLNIINYAIKCGKKTALPRVTDNGNMEACVIENVNRLTNGAYNIPEPPDECEVLSPDCIDFILVPGVAFDLRFYRLGRGGGYYDRFLTGTRAVKAAVAGIRQIVKKVPTEPHDVPVDIIITEQGILRKPQSVGSREL